MGSITVEGLGIVEIEGDEPNEIEQNAILSKLAEDDEDPVAAQVEEPAAPTAPDPNAPTKPREGPLGIVPKEVRGSVRETVENQPGLLQLITELAPSVGGALVGAAAGTPFGPPGILTGAIIGGVGGETIGQETGVAPESKLNIALSAGGPVLGPAVGSVVKAGRRVAGFLSTKLPFAAAARAKNVVGEVVDEFESLGTRILDKQTGLQARPASDLYGAVRRSGVVAPGKFLDNTRDAINRLKLEMSPSQDLEEVGQALKMLERIAGTIAPGKPSLIINKAGQAISAPNTVSIDTLVAIRQQVGIAVRRAESKGGVKLGAAKKLFATISDDLDRIASSPDLSRRAARLAQAAVKRAKLEFSVKDFEGAVAKFTKDTPDATGTVININGLQKWLRDVTNPKHANFDKNFVTALKDELPAIKERMVTLSKILGKGGSAGGPGSLVIRGRLTSQAVGIMAGLGMAGPTGGIIGALIGTHAPEMLVGMLTTKTGSAFLEGAANLGKGTINIKSWIAAGQAATRLTGEQKEGRRKADFDRKQQLTSGQEN